MAIDNIKKKIKIATRSRKHEDTRRRIACPWNPLSLVIAAEKDLTRHAISFNTLGLIVVPKQDKLIADRSTQQKRKYIRKKKKEYLTQPTVHLHLWSGEPT